MTEHVCMYLLDLQIGNAMIYEHELSKSSYHFAHNPSNGESQKGPHSVIQTIINQHQLRVEQKIRYSIAKLIMFFVILICVFFFK